MECSEEQKPMMIGDMNSPSTTPFLHSTSLRDRKPKKTQIQNGNASFVESREEKNTSWRARLLWSVINVVRVMALYLIILLCLIKTKIFAWVLPSRQRKTSPADVLRNSSPLASMCTDTRGSFTTESAWPNGFAPSLASSPTCGGYSTSSQTAEGMAGGGSSPGAQ